MDAEISRRCLKGRFGEFRGGAEPESRSVGDPGEGE